MIERVYVRKRATVGMRERATIGMKIGMKDRRVGL